MYEQERQRSIHLMVLLCYTVFTVAVIVQSILLGWESGAVVLILLGFTICWGMHITEIISEDIRLWLYFILSMLTIFFYGIHEVSVFDLASVMVVFMLTYSATGKYIFVKLCFLIYYLIMCYDFVFVIGNPLKLPAQEGSQLFLHFGTILIVERLTEAIIRRHRKDRKKADEKIFQLEETNRRVEDFLTNVSHELRTPINAVMGITTVMMKNEKDPKKKKDMVSIQMAGNRLFSQIEDILDYTEIDTDRIIVSEENYMVSSLLNDIVIENRLMKSEKELELIFDMDVGIPLVLLGDGRKIKKIIRHLVDNAVKFTKKGGVYVRVYALHKTYGINLCINVSDTGVGIAEEELGKITERFFQSSGGRNRKSGGLGLGLPIVHGMVTAMGGFMQIKSTEGSGTTVSISIPQKVADATPSMVVPNRADLCIACYLKQEKYKVPEVRDYYRAIITHMVRELELTLHKVFELEELKRLVAMYQLTHLLIGVEEYEEDTAYFEALNKEIDVVVVANDHFQPAKNSRVKVVRKPIYCLPIVNILNSQVSYEVDAFERENMICPGVRVLVVDDEPMNLMVARGIFKAYQMEVKTAGSGMEAIEICEKEEFDLIFLDHMMPEMDGVETLKMLRKTQMDTGRTHTFIAFTANAVSGAKEMFLQEGFDAFISKPIEDQELKRLLKNVLPKTSIVYADENDKVAVKVQEEALEQATVEQSEVQEPVAENAPKKEKLIRLEESGFHTEVGLQYCNNDYELYDELLTMFAKSAEGKIADMESAFKDEDIKNYQILVHALKSTSKMTGAGMLSEMARKAEEAAKKQDVSYIQKNHRELLDKYRKMVQCILDVLGIAELVSSEGTLVAETGTTKEEMLQHLSELRESLETFEADKAGALLMEMSELVYQGTSVRTLLCDIKQDVENFELGEAAEKVEMLVRRVEGGEV